MSFIIIKPDAIERNLVGQILSRFERKGYCIDRLWTVTDNLPSLVAAHYAEHKDKAFYDGLCEFMVSGNKLICATFCDTDEDSIKAIRALLGDIATPGTIRGDYGTSTRHNCVHASANINDQARELCIWNPE